MEELLIEYLKSIHNYEYIKIWNYNVDGAICTVTYSTYEYSTNTAPENINIWDMLVFVNIKNRK